MAALGSQIREQIIAEINANPGIHMRELERRIGVSFSTIDHHLQVLEADERVVAFWDGHFRRFFSRDLILSTESRRLGNADRQFLAACRRPASLAVILNLAAEGGLRHGELLARIKRTKSTLTYHLDHLASAGLVRVSSESDERRYELTDRDRAIALLVTFADVLQGHADGFAELWLSLRSRLPADVIRRGQ